MDDLKTLYVSALMSSEPSRKRPWEASQEPPNRPDLTKAELQAALKLGKQPFKQLREIGKQLEKFPPISREGEIDLVIQMSDLSMKKYEMAQIFVCHRCDHVKTSNMKAKFRGEALCGSCFDHVTRCVIPYRDLPDHQRPQRCIHKVPKTYQKQFR